MAARDIGAWTTVYVAENGGVAAHLKGSYGLLFTNRLILALDAESNLLARQTPTVVLGTELGNIELQMRLRYEINRKVAPYVGIDWDRAVGSTADRQDAAGRGVSEARVVAGLRVWR